MYELDGIWKETVPLTLTFHPRTYDYTVRCTLITQDMKFNSQKLPQLRCSQQHRWDALTEEADIYLLPCKPHLLTSLPQSLPGLHYCLIHSTISHCLVYCTASHCLVYSTASLTSVHCLHPTSLSLTYSLHHSPRAPPHSPASPFLSSLAYSLLSYSPASFPLLPLLFPS